MQLGIKTEKYGSGSQRWLGSAHGTDVARTVTIDGTKLTSFTTGVIPAGTALKKGDGGKYEPVTEASDALAGFLLTDQSFTGATDVVAPLVWHGRIRADFLPQSGFDVTTLTTPNPQFTIEKEA
ncbi:hypothetical protein [Corynebacterium auriscanis]|uniref:Head decoration protein n=2 Tax=Corynebacterium auriscanis TaxID=99807 RepID=A0A0A2DG48_9CORY|nr:hypothetical protein [Corynebacterium auriscanis]KGM18150.1 hypothetical protein MA47_09700 [Corynebacterium auriscanis]WJY73228.1 hypothetical protein CAURIC_08075 [Corynebacterium auriscanis]